MPTHSIDLPTVLLTTAAAGLFAAAYFSAAPSTAMWTAVRAPAVTAGRSIGLVTRPMGRREPMSMGAPALEASTVAGSTVGVTASTAPNMLLALVAAPLALVGALALLRRPTPAAPLAMCGYGGLKTSAFPPTGGATIGAHAAGHSTELQATVGTVPFLDKSAMQRVLDETDVFVFDCDGVIWKGDRLIEQVPETLELLKSMGKKLFFVTNNSTKSRAGYLDKFLSLGLNVKADEIYSSSFAAAAYLESIAYPKDKPIYIIGEVGIEQELELLGFKYIGGPKDAGKVIELKAGFALEHDHNVGAVIVGFDRYFNYYKIQYAQLCINENPGCLFIATNTDAVTHLTDVQEWAGNGSMVGCIKGCTGKNPVVVGKPSGFMMDNIAAKFGISKHRICMVGDRLDTDILFGQENGTNDLLVLSGVTDEEKLLDPKTKVKPSGVIHSIADFLALKP